MFGLFSKKPGDSADGKGSGNAGASATGSRDSRSDGAKSRRASGKTLVSMLGSVGKQTSVKSILKKGAHGRVESDSDEGSDSRDEFDFGSDGGLSPAALADRRAIGSANGDSASRGSRRRVAKPPQDGPVLNGAFVGAPYAQDGRGNVSIYAQGGEFWLLASQLACYNVPEQYHQDVFLYFCPKRNPKDGTSFDPSKCVRIFVPGYSESGALPPPPAADSLEELADLRFSLSECYDEKRGENVAVDPRRYQSIVACKPGVLDINGNEQVPTVIYGYVNLVKVGSSREEQAAEMAAKLRRQSVAMAEFSQDAMQVSCDSNLRSSTSRGGTCDAVIALIVMYAGRCKSAVDVYAACCTCFVLTFLTPFVIIPCPRSSNLSLFSRCPCTARPTRTWTSSPRTASRRSAKPR